MVAFSIFVLKRSSFFQKIAEAEVSERYEALDGLRGFLAIGVFFQHAVQNFSFFQTGVWVITDSRFYRFLGGEAVILFFITTSFLYWTKLVLVKSHGENQMFRLYRSRLLRLAPLYLFSGLLVSIIALYNVDFSIISISGFFRDIFYWLTLGLHTIQSFNGTDIIPINAGIHWTLRYEWAFYLLLPLVAFLMKNSLGKIASVLILIGIFSLPDRGYWAIFLFGILSAYIVSYYPSIPWFKKNNWSALVPLVGLFLVYSINYKPYSYVQYFISMIVFLCFVYGNNLFGLLKTPFAKFLSTISYSVYLLHGIVLYIVLNIVNKFYPVASLSPLQYWTVILFAGIIVIVVSALSYRFIEHRFIEKIKLGKKGSSPTPVIEKVI
ncbi:MAG: acyltransferase [Minisyncoccia bacterium]